MNAVEQQKAGGTQTGNLDVTAEKSRGRKAERPTDIPLRGWQDVSWRAAKRFSDDNVTLIAGALLSVFPALADMVSIYGMFATPGDVITQMSAFAGVLPPGVWDIWDNEGLSLPTPSARLFHQINHQPRLQRTDPKSSSRCVFDEDYNTTVSAPTADVRIGWRAPHADQLALFTPQRSFLPNAHWTDPSWLPSGLGVRRIQGLLPQASL